MEEESAIIKVRVNPRSSCSRLVGWKDGVLTIKITAPPVEGAANKACVDFLAGQLGVRKSRVSIVSGSSSRDKLVRIEDLSREEVLRRLNS